MFYTMKSGILFVVASLTLVGAMVAIAAPNIIEAAPKHTWCYTGASIVCNVEGNSFDTKGECKKAEKADPSPIIIEPCHKVPL